MNTYLNLYEIGKTQRFQKNNLKGHNSSKRHWKKLKDFFFIQYLNIHKDILKYYNLENVYFLKFRFGIDL